MSSEGRDPSASSSGHDAVDPMLGQILDKRYRLTKKLGEGGMGEVYAADHLRIARSVAIKLLRPEVLTNAEAVKRFEQEAMTASSIGHDNIIRIEDSGKLEDGRIYLAMELLEGAAFNDLIEDQLIAPERLLHILIQTCHGLAAAHEKGIVHRDMKPENIYITRGADGGDVPKLLDFGIAKVSQAEGENHLTRTGTIFGTPFYMAPEQALGQAVDHRVDIYAMGVIMYEVFTGSVPFGGESFMGILTQHITAEPALPSLTAQQNGRVIPPGVEDVILRAMRKEPNERYQTMNDLCQALVPLYRQLAGSGMSTYMAAHMPAPSGGVPAYPNRTGSPTPMPVIRDERSQPYALPQMQGAGASMHAHAMGTQPPHGYQQGGMHPGASDSLMVPARKSRAGLYLVLLLLLLGAGGGAAFFLLGGDDESSEAVASNDGDSGKTDPNNGDPDKNNDPSENNGGNTQVAVPVDAGQAAVVPADAAPTQTPDPVEPVIITVLLNSSPSGAKVYRDGKKLGSTPLIIKVDNSKPQLLVLKRSKYRDEEVTLDGSSEKVTADLSRVGSSNRPDPDKPDPDKPDPDKPDPDKPDPNKPVDPCKKNPNLPECMLE